MTWLKTSKNSNLDKIYSKVREKISFAEEDRFLYQDMKLAKESLADLSYAISLLSVDNNVQDQLTSFIYGASEYLQGKNEKARKYLFLNILNLN